MNNTVATTEGKPKPIDTVRNALEKLKPQFAMALPKHLTPDRLLRVAITAVQNTPKLLECDRTSLYSAIMACAQLGLEPDGVLGQAYLVPFGGKVQFIPGYRGLITLARNSGDVLSIAAHEVREKDHFEFNFGLEEKLEHKPAHGDRGDIIYFYAYAKFKDGGHYFDVMTKDEVDGIRNNSSGYKSAISSAKKYGKPISSPWEDHYVEMGKKTAVRRIAKYLPMSVQKAAALEDMYDSGRMAHLGEAGEVVIDAEISEVDDTKQISSPSSKLDEFEKGLEVEVEGEGDDLAHDTETGEIVEGITQGGDLASPSDPRAQAKQSAEALGHDDGLKGLKHEPEQFKYKDEQTAYSTGYQAGEKDRIARAAE